LNLHDTYLEVSGARLFVRRLLHPAPVSDGYLLFLHDALGCVESWKDFPRQLCERLQCHGLLYDRQGHGHSAPWSRLPGPAHFEREAWEVLPALLRQLGIQPSLVLGHSDGATLAWMYASRFPLPAALITLSGHIKVEEVTREGIRQQLHALQQGDALQRLRRYHGGQAEALLAAWSGLWLSDAFADWNISKLLEEVSAPCLLIQGREDEYATPAQFEEIAHHLGGSVEKHLLNDCKHFPHKEKSAEVLSLIASFVAIK
jgi:pimeloyl-ACP methyl ester carboxylesterase